MENNRNEFHFYWKDEHIANVLVVGRDMWYLSLSWHPLPGEAAGSFEKQLAAIPPKTILTHPEKTLRVELRSATDPEIRLYCLAMMLSDGVLDVREVVNEAARDMFFPDRNS